MKRIAILMAALFMAMCGYAQNLPVGWEELTSPDFVKAVEKSEGVCLIPMGVLEKHGPHLPLGTDVYTAREISQRAAQKEYCIVYPYYFVGQIFEAKHQPGTVAYSTELIYKMLEEEIIPVYFAKNSKGYSPEWIQFIKNSLAKITPRFTMKRQLDDYISRFYSKLEESGAKMKADNFKAAKELAAWKDKVAAAWDSIEVVSLDISEAVLNHAQVGDYCDGAICLNTNLGIEDIGIEAVVTMLDKNNELEVFETEAFKPVKAEDSRLYFQLKNFRIERAGMFKLGIRMFPKNELLANRQSFNYVRWI